MPDVKEKPLILEIVEPHVVLMTPADEIKMYPKRIEQAGRVAYKSESKITEDSADRFVRKLLKPAIKHESVLEHCSVTVKLVGDRSMSHQLVRHRIAAYTQESQRYCNYSRSGALQVIVPPSIDSEGILKHGDFVMLVDGTILVGADGPDGDGEPIHRGVIREKTALWVWAFSTLTSYRAYKDLKALKIPGEDARSVLPNATKTEVVTTYNIRQWRHFFKMRCDKHAQWQIRGLAMAVLETLYELAPSLFHDKYEQFFGEEESGD